MTKRKSNNPSRSSSPGKPAETAKSSRGAGAAGSGEAHVDSAPRIIGGTMRGRKLFYSGDERTRPMKDRVRESIFNLIGSEMAGGHAIDLFAGVGALGLEAISRGASHATFIEQHFPTAALIEQSAAALGVKDRCQVIPGDAFIWGKRRLELGSAPWIVFSSPPYSFYVDRLDEMLSLIGDLIARAPARSVFVVESDDRFDFDRLPFSGQWDERRYPPAEVAILRVE